MTHQLIRWVFLFLAVLHGCVRQASAQTVRTFPTEQEPVLSTVDLSRYAPPPQPDLTEPVRLTAVVATDAGAASGAQAALVRQGARYDMPFNGICLNEPAQALVESAFYAQHRTLLNDSRRAQAELGAQAIRDLQLIQTDINILRAVYAARIRARDIELESANRIILDLNRQSSSQTWQTVGWVTLGVMAGFGLGSLLLLTRP